MLRGAFFAIAAVIHAEAFRIFKHKDPAQIPPKGIFWLFFYFSIFWLSLELIRVLLEKVEFYKGKKAERTSDKKLLLLLIGIYVYFFWQSYSYNLRQDRVKTLLGDAYMAACVRGNISILGRGEKKRLLIKSGEINHLLRLSNMRQMKDNWRKLRFGVEVKFSKYVDVDKFSNGGYVCLCGNLQNYRQSHNPHDYDQREFMRKSGSAAIFKVGKLGISYFDKQTFRAKWYSFFAKRRAKISSLLEAGIGNKSWFSKGLPIARSMLLGDSSAMAEDTFEKFRKSGALHLFAVSGLHVGVLMLTVYWMCLLLRISAHRALIISIFLAWLYCFISGARPSAIRAASMATLILPCFALRRELFLQNILGLVALVVLLFNHFYVYDLGFQLSFGATLSIIFFVAYFRELFKNLTKYDEFIPREIIRQRILNRRFKYLNWHRIFFFIYGVFAVSLSAWFITAPLVWLNFGGFYPQAPIANTLLLPVAWLVITSAFLSILFASLGLLFISAFFNHFMTTFAIFAGFLAGYFSKFPWIVQKDMHVGARRSRHFAEWLLKSEQVNKDEKFPRRLDLTIFKVSYGGACAALFDHKQRIWFIDVGDNYWSKTFIETQMPYFEQKIGGIFLTHWDYLHIGGRDNFLASRALDSESKLYTHLRLKKRLITRDYPLEKIKQLKRGDKYYIARDNEYFLTSRDFVSFEVLHPPARKEGNLADDHPLVLKLKVWDWRIIFASDAGFSAEKSMIASKSDLDADILVSSIHANDFSSTTEFTQEVNPALHIRANSFGEHYFDEANSSVFSDEQSRKELIGKKFGALHLRILQNEIKIYDLSDFNKFSPKAHRPILELKK